MSDILNNLRKIVGDMEARNREYPVVIAIACQPRFYEQIKNHFSPSQQSSLSPILQPAPSLPIVGIPIYRWRKLPQEWKAFYSKEEFREWYEAYGEEGDSLPN